MITFTNINPDGYRDIYVWRLDENKKYSEMGWLVQAKSKDAAEWIAVAMTEYERRKTDDSKRAVAIARHIMHQWLAVGAVYEIGTGGMESRGGVALIALDEPALIVQVGQHTDLRTGFEGDIEWRIGVCDHDMTFGSKLEAEMQLRRLGISDAALHALDKQALATYVNDAADDDPKPPVDILDLHP